MNPRKLGLILLAGGAAGIGLALVWFAAVFSDAMDMASTFAGDDHAARLMACVYSSDPICQGAIMFSDGPAYSPVVFWIGVIALLGGVVVLFASSKSPVAAGASQGRVPNDRLLGFILPVDYARYSYVLALAGAVAGLLVMPLALAALAAFGLALLGLTTYRPRLTALDVHHLGLICLIFVTAAMLLFITRGTFLFLLVALAQIAALYVGFNSHRHGRLIDSKNVKEEIRLAVTPGARPTSAPNHTEPQPDGDNP